MCSYLVSDKWYANRQENPDCESFHIIEAAAKLIAAEIREIECDMNTYPAYNKEVVDEVDVRTRSPITFAHTLHGAGGNIIYRPINT